MEKGAEAPFWHTRQGPLTAPSWPLHLGGSFFPFSCDFEAQSQVGVEGNGETLREG